MNLKDKLSQPGFLLVILTILGIATLVLGFFQIREAIQGPFARSGPKSKPITQEDLDNFFKKQDTDQDGLSDYDEGYVYKTSPYLVDSDSDSYSDFEEIKAGSNPLDPQSTPYRKQGSEGSILEQTFPKGSETSGLKDKPSPTPAGEGGEISAQEIRKLLIQAGLDQATVDKIDDKTLKELYSETKKETGINPQTAGQGSASIEQNAELTPERIRQLLLLGGADPEILKQVDDQTLKMIFEQMVTESR